MLRMLLLPLSYNLALNFVQSIDRLKVRVLIVLFFTLHELFWYDKLTLDFRPISIFSDPVKAATSPQVPRVAAIYRFNFTKKSCLFNSTTCLFRSETKRYTMKYWFYIGYADQSIV